MKETGWLLYECRLCGTVSRCGHVPDIIIALSYILNKQPIPATGNLVNETSIHICTDSRIGITDIIGGRERL